MGAYQKATQSLDQYIRKRGIRPGHRLPSERELCDLLGVSRKTLRKVLADYERSRLIDRRGQAGTFLAALPGSLDNVSPLKRTRSNLVSVMFVGPPASQVERQHRLHRMLQEQGCLLHSYFSFPAGESPEREKEYLLQLLDGGVAGVIAQATPIAPTNRPVFQFLAGSGVRVAHLFKYASDFPAESFFLPDIQASALGAMGWLAGQGARRFAFVAPLRHSHPMVADLLSVRALASSSLHIDMIDARLPWRENGQAADHAAEAYRKLPPDTGILCLYRSVAQGVWRNLQAAFPDPRKRPPMICIDEGEPDETHAETPPCPTVMLPWAPRVKDALDYILGDNPAPVRKMYAPVFMPTAKA